MTDKIKPQRQARIKPEIALRNIFRNMEIKGCRRILESGENGKGVADILVGDIVMSEEHEGYNFQES